MSDRSETGCDVRLPDGWLPCAERVDSPNFGPRPSGTAIDLIVLHSISLPPGVYEGDAVTRLFTNQLDWNLHPYFRQIEGLRVSSHFLIRRDGHILQFVSCLDRAWHAGASSYCGRDNCNDYSIGIELEGLEGDLFEDAQYASLQELGLVLMQHFPISHIAGHEHVAPTRKSDPGAGFDWARLREQLGVNPACFPAQVQGLL